MPSICPGGNSREENKLRWGHAEGAGDGDPHHDFQQMLVFLSDLPLGCDLPLPHTPPSSAGLTQAMGVEPHSGPSTLVCHSL